MPQTPIPTAQDHHYKPISTAFQHVNLVHYHLTFQNLKNFTFPSPKGQTSNHTQNLSSKTYNSSLIPYITCLQSPFAHTMPNSHTHLLKPHENILLLLPHDQNPSQIAQGLKTDREGPKTVLEMHLHCQNFNEIGLWFQHSIKPSKVLQFKWPSTYT